jgi:ABC-type phosphate transport system substrate-binding protein
MFPTVVSGIVPVVDLRKGGAPLKLSGEVLARIFLGEISHWQAPEIVALNPGVACRTSRSAWCAGAMAPARPTISPTT